MLHRDAWDALLAEYVEGTLPPARARVVARHLAECAECRAGVELARMGSTALQALPAPAAGDSTADFLAAVERRAARHTAALGASPPRPRRTGPVPAALQALAGADQARPVAWMLLASPALGFILAPGAATLAIAAAGLALGALLDYAITAEGPHYD